MLISILLSMSQKLRRWSIGAGVALTLATVPLTSNFVHGENSSMMRRDTPKPIRAQCLTESREDSLFDRKGEQIYKILQGAFPKRNSEVSILVDFTFANGEIASVHITTNSTQDQELIRDMERKFIEVMSDVTVRVKSRCFIENRGFVLPPNTEKTSNPTTPIIEEETKSALA